MATTTDIERHEPRQRGTRRMEVANTDRTKDFIRARRHTAVVRLMRRLLPVASAGVVLLYAGMVIRTAGWGEALIGLTIPRILPEHLTMNNPRYEGFNSDGGNYVVTAKTARQDLDEPMVVKLETIDGDLWDARKSKTNLKATRGTYDNKRGRLELFDGIRIVSDDGSRATLTSATVLPKESLVVSKEPVLVEMPTGTVQSKEMTLRQKLKQVTFLRDVVAHMKPPEKPKDKPPAENAWETETQPAGGAAAASAAPLFGSSDKPIDVTSGQLDIDDIKKTAVFKGAVHAVQGDATLTTPELTIIYESDASADASAGAEPTASGFAAGQGNNKLSRILATDPVVLNQAPNTHATGQALEYDAKTETATLSGNVTITSAPDRQAASDRAEFNSATDTALLTGNVVVMQGRNELRGRRLFVDRKAGTTSLTAPPENRSGPGRITARFYQGEQSAEQATAKAKPKVEPSVQGAVAAFKTSPGAPIDIEANALDVDDNVKLAVFRGDVHAVQGDFNVRTAELHAHYTGQSGLADPAAAPSSGDASKLTRIEAKRKVVVTSKAGQSATGDYADFDTSANTVTLTGDVVLTQGQNVVRGTRLVIDMATGHTRIQTEPSSGPVTSSLPASGTGPPAGFPTGAGAFRSGRPSAVFYPKQVRDQTKSDATKKSKPDGHETPAAASSWQATTAPSAGPAKSGN